MEYCFTSAFLGIVLTNHIFIQYFLDLNGFNQFQFFTELQVVNEHNWVPRSIYYVCSNYKNLKSGEDYNEAMPSVHIGFLDFTLFEEHPALYSTYRMLEVKEHYEYTDKLQIGVLDLTKIDLATEEDKAYNIHEWAELFKAQTWEDI